MAIYDADIIRALREGENVDNLRLSLSWRARERFRREEEQITEQLRHAKLIQMNLQEPEDSAAYQLAAAWLEAEERKLEDETEVDKERRRMRVELEELYNRYLMGIPYIRENMKGAEQ